MDHNGEAISTGIRMQDFRRNRDANHEYSSISSAPDEHHDSYHEPSTHQKHQPSQAEDDQQPLVQHGGTQSDGSRFTLWLSIQLFVTIIIVVFIAVTVKTYQRKGNMSHRQKYAFNTIATALILFLGLSFFVSLDYVEKALEIDLSVL